MKKFSLFREFVAKLEEYHKQFIIWGNNNAITYKEIFPLIKDGKMWLGYRVNKTCYFKLSSDYPKWDEKFTAKMHDGNHYGKVPAISTFTNIDTKKRHHKLETVYRWRKHKEWYPDLYPKYDNLQHKSNGQTANGSKVNTGAAIAIDNPKGTYYTADNSNKKLEIKYARILIKNKHPEDY